MKRVRFDVMLGERFVHTMSIDVNPIFPLSDEEVREYVISKLPTLKNKKFHIEFCNENNR